MFLDGQHITKLSGLENLANLRWASFNDNYITNIEVLNVILFNLIINLLLIIIL